MKHILLTFDLEEFDIPREFNQDISEKEMYEVSQNGLINLLRLLDKHNLSATFFTTANFANKFPQILKKLSQKHEIASHGYSHSDKNQSIDNIRKAKKEKEKLINKTIKGFRAPRYNIKNISELSKLGFQYDSSSHPIFLPGRYFNVNQKRTIHKLDDIFEIPLSTLPLVNLSIFWLAFKNFPLFYSKIFTKINFLSSNYTMLVFHPWEFSPQLSKYKIPFYTKRNPKKLLKKLEKYVIFCRKNNYKFKTVENHLSKTKI